MTESSARVVLDSLHPDGRSRLTTLEVVMHRFVLAEFNTHRVKSRNSASSRAIPLTKQLQRVEEDLAFPVSWPAEQRGMQGGEELPGEVVRHARVLWRSAAYQAQHFARLLGEAGVHKSVCNRLLEPFLWHTVIVSSIEWDNFFALRCNRLAQPEMRAAAEAIRVAYEASTPTPLDWEDWHLPLVTGVDFDEIVAASPDHVAGLRTAKLISAARCARVSYLTHDGRRDWSADLELAHRLLNPGEGAPHASPFEHVATPAYASDIVLGNFQPRWHQLRHRIASEFAIL